MEESNENVTLNKRRGRKPLPENVREVRKRESNKKYDLNRKNIGGLSTKEELNKEINFLKEVIFFLQFSSNVEVENNVSNNQNEESTKKYKKKELNNEIKHLKRTVIEIEDKIKERYEIRYHENSLKLLEGN